MNTVTVSTVEELRAAAADPSVGTIICEPGGTYVINSPIVWAPRSVTLNGQGSSIAPLLAPPPGTYYVPDDAECVCGHLISRHDGWIKGRGALYCLACRCHQFEAGPTTREEPAP